MRAQVLIRLLDLITLAMLVGPYQSARTFAAVLVGFLAFAGLLAAMGMTQAMARKIQGQSIVQTSIAVAFNVLYVAALIYSDYPILAAGYAIAATVMRSAAYTALKEQEAP